MPDPETSALAVYWRFFEGTNSRDSRRVTDALNYPHVRISARGNPMGTPISSRTGTFMPAKCPSIRSLQPDGIIPSAWNPKCSTLRRARYISGAAGPDMTVATNRS